MNIRDVIPARYRYSLSNIKHKIFGYRTYSQCGEDIELLKLFTGRVTGTYVDVGAHHPKRYSNTYLLHVQGWCGINIDPDPNAIALFNKARPHDKNIECGIAAKEGNLTYYSFSDPAVNTFVEKEAKRWMNKDWLKFLGTRSIAVRPLSSVLYEHALDKPIDLLSVDAEGMGLEVLKSNDWTRWTPKIIVVEDDVRTYLEEKGYYMYRECGLSNIYVHSSFKEGILTR